MFGERITSVAFERLEPCEWKLSFSVLRGVCGREAAYLRSKPYGFLNDK